MTEDFWKHLKRMPHDIVAYCIFPFLGPETLVWTSKTNYNTHNNVIRSLISNSDFESYIRMLVRKDYSFVFEHVIRENIQRWLKMTRYRYNNQLAVDYLHFIYYYAGEQRSNECEKLINHLACEMLGSKWHKRNGVRSIRTKWNA